MLLISHLNDAKAGLGASAADVGRVFHLKLGLCGCCCVCVVFFLGGGGGSFEAVCSGGNLFKF